MRCMLDEICLDASGHRAMLAVREGGSFRHLHLGDRGDGPRRSPDSARSRRICASRGFRNADCYAQPSTVAGRDIMIATGFEPIPSFQPDLWCYERPWHRLPMRMPGANIQARSFADARY